MIYKRIKASMTVEAVFVIPIVLFVIFALIYLTFYLHDYVRLEEIVERGLVQGNFLTVPRSSTDGKAVAYETSNSAGNWGYWTVSYEAEEEMLKQFLEEELKQGFFVLSKENVFCEMNGFSMKIRIKMKGKFSFSPVGYLWDNMPEILLERSIPIYNPEEIQRIFEGIGIINEDMESTAYVKNYMEKLQNAIEKGADECLNESIHER